MFDKILIANRGEIACRVARTARRMGIRTVAVYSDADADALHVAACDEAYRLGPPPPRESYLDGEAIIAIAKRTGAQAIHPGYGFLSENEGFAAALRARGPRVHRPAAGGDRGDGLEVGGQEHHGQGRRAARARLPRRRPGRRRCSRARRRRSAIPVLIKATAGGGGKGMKIVERADDFAAALASAQREAKAGFGDDRVLIEKYLTAPRHIEIQVFADTHGNAVYLFERDCSVQRRHQKVLEEAPAPGMKPEHRRAMGEAAVAARRRSATSARAPSSSSPRIVRARRPFYFMEMNTRLQVEHPVTEMITGVDLVEWQLRVAAGEPLPKRQDELAIAATRSRRASTPRIRSAASCRRSARSSHLRAPADGRRRCASTPACARATRSRRTTIR